MREEPRPEPAGLTRGVRQDPSRVAGVVAPPDGRGARLVTRVPDLGGLGGAACRSPNS